MRVVLVSYLHDAEKIVAIASKISRTRKGWREIPDEEVDVWIREAFLHNYLSPFEHISYTFSIEGISRVASHQLIRHRIASYTQTSHRFARPIDQYYQPVVPPSAEGKIEELYKKEYEMYFSLLSSGVPEEDARYILPNGVNTNIVVTMNARELINFFALRLCSRAQWEIREVAWAMFEQVRSVHPRIFKYAGPSCILHENWIRKEPITVDDKKEFVSERCVEGVPRDGIWRCIQNARSSYTISNISNEHS
ncbi:thymidylate synthase (FAD) [Sulfolobales archaeon HS-7]|nr:thymidylate synthase (FAD) [Sulfolobales archaeon HS-7]